jgi:hypothetical protein
MKKLSFIIAFAFVCMSYTGTKYFNNPVCPLSYTSSPNASTGVIRTCALSGCHSDVALNSGGGTVTVSGLPTSYTAGTTYNFSVTISHPTANRAAWGFAIKAVNTTNNWVVGTFATTNANASVKGAAGATATTQTRELSHNGAPVTAVQMSYTFTNLSWTAPALPGVNDNNIKFYVVGNAADNSGDEVGDFIYSNVYSISKSVVPITLVNFTANTNNKNVVNISWQTEQEINASHFDVETSSDAVTWKKITTMPASGNSSSPLKYNYTDSRPLRFNANVYYRLKSVDIDGTFKYSDIKSVIIKNEDVVIYDLTSTLLEKNTNDMYSIRSKKAFPMNITVVDASARILYSTIKNINEGENTIEIPRSKLSTGSKFYVVQFIANGFKKSFTKMTFQ